MIGWLTNRWSRRGCRRDEAASLEKEVNMNTNAWDKIVSTMTLVAGLGSKVFNGTKSNIEGGSSHGS
jgi:hypothetical protein